MTFELALVLFVTVTMLAVLVAAILDQVVWRRARSARLRRMTYREKCKRLRLDGPTPCLCCKEECRG